MGYSKCTIVFRNPAICFLKPIIFRLPILHNSRYMHIAVVLNNLCKHPIVFFVVRQPILDRNPLLHRYTIADKVVCNSLDLLFPPPFVKHFPLKRCLLQNLNHLFPNIHCYASSCISTKCLPHTLLYPSFVGVPQVACSWHPSISHSH